MEIRQKNGGKRLAQDELRNASISERPVISLPLQPTDALARKQPWRREDSYLRFLIFDFYFAMGRGPETRQSGSSALPVRLPIGKRRYGRFATFATMIASSQPDQKEEKGHE